LMEFAGASRGEAERMLKEAGGDVNRAADAVWRNRGA
jgi:NACalpha-BTF3-like transcription factor